MTKLLEEVIAKAGNLPEREQDEIARLLLDEIESERAWDDLVGRPPEKLRKLADTAWAEHEAGRSEVLDKLLERLSA